MNLAKWRDDNYELLMRIMQKALEMGNVVFVCLFDDKTIKITNIHPLIVSLLPIRIVFCCCCR